MPLQSATFQTRNEAGLEAIQDVTMRYIELRTRPHGVFAEDNSVRSRRPWLGASRSNKWYYRALFSLRAQSTARPRLPCRGASLRQAKNRAMYLVTGLTLP